ncbi:MAG: hypothetical protein R3C56_24460 [Pirellulaceae bacterium]
MCKSPVKQLLCMRTCGAGLWRSLGSSHTEDRQRFLTLELHTVGRDLELPQSSRQFGLGGAADQFFVDSPMGGSIF